MWLLPLHRLIDPLTGSKRDLRSARILVIWCEEPQRTEPVRLLRDEGWDVAVVDTVEDGLTLAEASDFDLFVLDKETAYQDGAPVDQIPQSMRGHLPEHTAGYFRI